MDADAYQHYASATAIYPKGSQISALSYLGLKLNGEAGEVADLIGKHIRDDGNTTNITDERSTKIAYELGDVLWYVAMLSHEIGFNLNTIMHMNLDKLKKRKTTGTLQGEGSDR